MEKLKKIYFVFSIILIVFGIISFGYSAVADILRRINSDIHIDAAADNAMLPYINGGIFICIGGILQILAGVQGIGTSRDIIPMYRPMLFGILAIAWEIVGFIILFTNRIMNIRLLVQIPMSFIFLAVGFTIFFKSTAGIKKKHIDLSIVNNLAPDIKVNKKDIKSVFKVDYRKKHVHNPIAGTKSRIRRVNIRPTRKFKK